MAGADSPGTSRPPFPFIVGCGRSGTTLVRTLVDSHPAVAVPGESYFVVELARRRAEWERAGGFAWRPFLEAVQSHERVQRWGMNEESVTASFREHAPGTYADAVRLLFSCYARQQGKPRFADKTPGYVYSLPLLAELFPEARFVHVVRDGRDTALALLDTSWGPRTVAAAATYWRDAVLAGRRFGRAHPDQYRELRYEDLVDDPELELTRLCSFLELGFDPAMLDHGPSAERWLEMSPYPQHHQRLHFPPSRGLRDWRTEMAPDDAKAFEALAGDALATMGYPCRERPPLAMGASPAGPPAESSDRPLVTVIVNCYNHAPWLRDCLESVRAQTYGNVQLIVMDDCSSDGSQRLIRAWLDRTGVDAVFVANGANRGLAATRNEGLRMAEGEYVAWVSTDDTWEPRKLEVQVDELQRLGPSVGVLYSDAVRIDPAGAVLPGTFLETVHDAPARPPEGDVFDRLIVTNFLPSMATLVRRDVLGHVGGYDPAVPIEDWDLWLRIARHARFAFSLYVSANYRVVPTSRINSITDGEVHVTTLLIARKHLGYRPQCDALLRRRAKRSASYLYESRHPGHRRYAWYGLRADPSLRTFITFAAAAAGVPHRRLNAVSQLLRKWRAPARAANGTRPAS